MLERKRVSLLRKIFSKVMYVNFISVALFTDKNLKVFTIKFNMT